eukprot:COSAG06_NODE_54_length_27948_cov_234.398671_24_plen_88_part_00
MQARSAERRSRSLSHLSYPLLVLHCCFVAVTCRGLAWRGVSCRVVLRDAFCVGLRYFALRCSTSAGYTRAFDACFDPVGAGQAEKCT